MLPATCATPETLAALRGETAPLYAEMLTPPARLGPTGRSSTAPPPAGRTWYGSPYDDHLETEHFTLNWWTSGVTEDDARRAGDALETAWTALVEEQGWVPPVSADQYFLWVLLDPRLGSTTGYTTEYFTDDYPDGYPVIYLNPSGASDAPFWSALSTHEFMHTLQYAVRDWSGSNPTESWYWEASATWAPEIADPDVDGHQYCSAWYASQPELRYDATDGSHHYGLFVFNAWLDELGVGPGAMLDVWTLSARRTDTPWDAILAESTGITIADLWAGFTGAYGNNELAESDLYLDAVREGVLTDGVGGSLPYLGSHYWRSPVAAEVRVEGDVILSAAGAVGASVAVHAGETLAVTGTIDGASYVLHMDTPNEDTGGDEPDTGIPPGDDTGPPDGDDTAGETGHPDDAPSARDDKGDEAPAGCGCVTAGPAPTPWFAAVFGVLAALRRRAVRR